LQKPRWETTHTKPFWEDEEGHINERLRETFEMHVQDILAPHVMGDVTSTFNFPIDNSINVNQMMDQFEYIYQNMDSAFRLNLSFGLILQNSENGRYRFFRAHQNGSLFSRPIRINNRRGADVIHEKLAGMNFVDYLLQQRDNTKSVPIELVNVVWYITKTNFPLGSPVILPAYIVRNKAILCMTKNYNNEYYSDNLCVFRCLSQHKHGSTVLTTMFYNKWIEHKYNKKLKMKDFDGISLTEIEDFEDYFKINVNIFQLTDKKVAIPVYRSEAKYSDCQTMNLNLFENHLSYIQNLKLYCKKYECDRCYKLFHRGYTCLKHYKKCRGVKCSLKFPGGYLKANKSISDHLSQIGIKFNDFYPYFAVYDFEAILEKTNMKSSDKLKWVQKHIPISVSICSNVPNFTEPYTIVEQNQEKLLVQMIDYLSAIQTYSFQLLLEKWNPIFEEIDNLKDKWGISDTGEIKNFQNDSDKQSKIKMKNLILDVEDKFTSYCSQLVCIAHNGGSYDLNLIKERLASILQLNKNAKFVVKRNNTYVCIATNKFKFVDTVQYLAPGTSYSSFLKSFQIEEKKGYFPYDWFDNVSKLSDTSLPPYEAFYSELKGQNILETEFLEWSHSKIGPTPKRGYEIYQDICDIWKKNCMSTFKDYLKYYNELDVWPFCKALQKMLAFYQSKNIDLFKSTISVPGVARQLLYKASTEFGAHFALFDKKNKDLYETFKSNIVGGPSIIFSRENHKNETKLHGSGPLCQSIVGYDANALYLYALDQEMPTGPFIRRYKKDGFKPHKRDHFLAMFHWMDWISQQQKIDILHKQNTNREVRIGPYMVDGFCTETKTVFEFQGCFYHPHDNCSLVKMPSSSKFKKLREKRIKQTSLKIQYLKDMGYKVICIQECEYNKLKQSNSALNSLSESNISPFYKKFRGSVTEKQILDAVIAGTYFGCIEVDIEVPNSWSSIIPHDTKLTPYDYFKEMSPIFCNTNVPFESIGKFMQNYVTENGLSQKPWKLLVGGMQAKKILLASPLLQWYLLHGLHVSKIYQCIEFIPKKCFSKFVEDVTQSRRLGDRNSDCEVLGNTMKLIGNSAYGSLLMDKEKHQNIKYVSGKAKACHMANQNDFKNMTELGNNFFEVELTKSEIKIDLPIQVGYFVLQIAKLRMLAFYYDFLSVYVDRHLFSLSHMDTDSFYIAIAGSSLSSVVKESKLQNYMAQINNFCGQNKIDPSKFWFPRECCKEHSSFDKRTPGLFKLEYSGDQVVALCSKTYSVKCNETGNTKFSSKGCNKSRLNNVHDIMVNVLKEKKDVNVVNRGFRVRNNTVYSYVQEKKGLCYFYCKRKVLDDGVTTVPLNVTLCPYDV
jgi:G:T-mismatch repair DNA endonuclease (very short patch repair protein)